MKQEEQIIQKYGKDSGMRIPEGYFADLEKNIMHKLPPYPEKTPTVALNRWHRIKPYVYLAAMFCGIWLMMKVFHTATQPLSMSLENPPQALVEMLEGGLDYEYRFQTYPEDYDIDEEDLIMSYDNIEDFKKDFYSVL